MSRNPNRFKRLWEAQHGRCYYCDVEMICEPHMPYQRDSGLLATEDHRLPRSRGGRHDGENTVLACKTCNGKKGRLSEQEFRLAFARWLQRKQGNAVLQRMSA